MRLMRAYRPGIHRGFRLWIRSGPHHTCIERRQDCGIQLTDIMLCLQSWQRCRYREKYGVNQGLSRNTGSPYFFKPVFALSSPLNRLGDKYSTCTSKTRIQAGYGRYTSIVGISQGILSRGQGANHRHIL